VLRGTFSPARACRPTVVAHLARMLDRMAMSLPVSPNGLQLEWFLPLFFAALLGVGALLTVASGWRTLSHRFPSVAQVEGERFHFASAKIGRVPWFPVNYGGCLIVTVTPSGLAVSIYLPFRLLCPEFFVPWAQIESVEERASALSRRTVVRIRGSSVRLALRGTVGQSVSAMFARVRTANVI
jgi:hypothetical protein